MTGGALNLSLLSRGVGEVHSNGHEKVDVYLEPEDYYNFTTHPSRTYLPPLSTYSHDLDEGHYTSRSSRDAYRVPKTFTTRKGALLLFSEDLAQRNLERPAKRHALASHNVTGSLDGQMDLKTVEDLAKSILKYGAQDEINGKVYLKFVHTQRNNFERQIRPGFSAKRYLATWTRTWDDSVFDNIIKNGYITERSLHQTNLMIPNLRRKLFYEDLSHMPQPYRLLKSMLLTPGSLSGYSFYRVETPGQYIEEDYMEDDIVFLKKQPDSIKSIRVVKTQEGVQEEVAYSDLDKEAQKDVITDLLVKSAVHYALKKQEEIYEESLRRSSKGEQSDDEVFVKDGASVTYEFDMKDAVESLLDSQHGKLNTGTKSIPGIDDRGHSIGMGGFYKAGAIQYRPTNKHYGSSSSRHSGSDSQEEGFPSGVPLVSVRRESGSSSEYSGVPVLPPIRHSLSPIRDVSRETTSQNVLLPSIGRGGHFLDPPTVTIEPATPQHSTLTASAISNSDAGDVSAAMDHDDKVSSSEFTESRNLKKSNKKRQLSKRDSGSQSESLKGSVIMAPDGEIISVGGSVARGGGSGHDIGNINDVMGNNRVEVTDESGLSEDEPEAWKTDKKLSIPLSDITRRLSKRGSGASSVSKDEIDRLSATGKHMLWDQASKLSGESSSQRSSITEKDILDTLADHAQVIAENVLARPEAGSDLETDVKRAADLWSKTHPSRSISRDDVIEGILQSTRSSSTASSAAEFKSLISKSLKTAVAKAAGIDPDSISADADVSPNLLQALANQSLTPDQIELVSGEDGKMKIQAKVDLGQSKEGDQHVHPQLGIGTGVPDGHDGKHVDKSSHLGYVEIDKFSYQAADVVNERDQRKVKSDVASEPESRPGSADHLAEVKSRVSFEDSPERSISKFKEDHVSSVQKSSVKETVSKARHTTPGGGESKPVNSKLKSDAIKEADKTKVDEQGTKQKKGKTKKEKKETSKPFVVGHVKEQPQTHEEGLPLPGLPKRGGPTDKNQNKDDSVKKDGKKKIKGKKKRDKKKEETEEPQLVAEEEPSASVEPQLPEQVETEETTLTEPQPSSPGLETEESEMDFHFVREPTSPEPDPATKTEDMHIPSPVPDEADETDEEEAGGPNLKSISNKEARAAKRAAAAAKKREEVERRRKEMEEKRKREKEEMERQISLQKELEEEKRRKEEERRLRKLQEWEAEEREKKDQDEAERRRRLEMEREKKLKEEYQRKMEEMRRKQLEEEMRRHEMLLEKQREEERQRIAEELMLSKMAEEERLEYERKKREIEEERKRRELEEKLKREEEARKAFEEAQRLAAEMARKQAELEARLRFNRSLQEESVNLTQSHQVNRAFVFSYFELLQWLGLDIPEFELAKLADY